MRIKIGSKYYIHSTDAGVSQTAIRNRIFHIRTKGKTPEESGYIKLEGGWYIQEDKIKHQS